VSRTVAGACAVLLASSSMLLARDPNAKPVYCWQGAKGDWSLQRFKPLINMQSGTVFAEMTFNGSVLEEVRVRRFYTDSELTFDYMFDGTGRLNGLRGSVTVKTPPVAGSADGERMLFADWVGEAELTPGRDGKIPPHHVAYTREKDRIDKPDNAETYVGRFNDAPVYPTIQSVPCAAMMKEAEKMNATQE
jgi:hypothetical protein